MEPTAFINLAFMSMATVLTIFSVHTLRLLAKLRLSKSLFIPVLMSAVFFWSGSFVSMVFSMYLQYIPNLIQIQEPINFLYQTTMLIGLSILTIGVFSYWRITRKVRLLKHERPEQGEEPQEHTQKTQQQEQTKQKAEETESETPEQNKDDQSPHPPQDIEPIVPEVVMALAVANNSFQTTLVMSPLKPQQRDKES